MTSTALIAAFVKRETAWNTSRCVSDPLSKTTRNHNTQIWDRFLHCCVYVCSFSWVNVNGGIRCYQEIVSSNFKYEFDDTEIVCCLQPLKQFSLRMAKIQWFRNFRVCIHGTQTRYVYLSRSSSKVFLLDDSWTQAVGFGQGVARSFLVVISITTPSAGKASFYGGPCGNLPFYPTTGERYLSL